MFKRTASRKTQTRYRYAVIHESHTDGTIDSYGTDDLPEGLTVAEKFELALHGVVRIGCIDPDRIGGTHVYDAWGRA